MARACAKLRSAIINLSVSHDGNPGLARHITNAVVKETSEGPYITKEHRGYTAKSTSPPPPSSPTTAPPTTTKPIVYQKSGMLVI